MMKNIMMVEEEICCVMIVLGATVQLFLGPTMVRYVELYVL